MCTEWKRTIIVLPLFIIMIFINNCAWQIYTKEKINRPPLDLTPLPESLLVLPDSNSNSNDAMILLQKKIIYIDCLFKPPSTQMFYAYEINPAGLTSITLCSGEKSDTYEIGYLPRSDILDFIFELNNIGFFKISKKRNFYDYFSIKKTYLFGFLIGKEQSIQRLYPSSTTSISCVQLKESTYTNSWRGVNDDANKYGDSDGLQVLKKGFEMIEYFFEENIRKFDEH